MPISSANRGPWPCTEARLRDRHGGFTLMEVVLALLIVAMIALLGLPFLSPADPTRALRSTSLEIISLLRHERNLAMRTRRPGTVFLNIQDRTISADLARSTIALPDGITLVPGPEDIRAITFGTDGRATDAVLTLKAGTQSRHLAIDPLTAMVSNRTSGR